MDWFNWRVRPEKRGGIETKCGGVLSHYLINSKYKQIHYGNKTHYIQTHRLNQ